MKKGKYSVLMHFLLAVAFNCFAGGAVAAAVGVPMIFGAVSFNVIGVSQNIVKHVFKFQSVQSGYAFAGLNREVWLAELMQKFRPDPAWIKEARDLSVYVNNDILNLAEAGADPNVIINFDSTYDLPIANTEDIPKNVQLYNMSTEQDMIPAALVKTRAYDIMSDRVKRHNATLEVTQLRLASYGFCPTSDSALTPVLAASGAATGGVKALTINDVIDLATRYGNENMNPNGVTPILVLNPTHLGQLAKEDKVLFKQFIGVDMKNGFDLLGFKAYKSTVTPLFNKNTGVRKAYGAVAAPSTDTYASFAFLPDEVGYAPGTKDAFIKKADPARQADFVNFAVRYFAGALRNKGIGAIYSGA